MISQLKGLVAEKDTDRVILDVQGVGYELAIPLSTYTSLPPVGEACLLFCELQAPEGLLRLFGFATREERALFDLLQSIAGVGPKLALAVLSTYSPPEFVSAVATDDINRLMRITGVGRRIAQRLVVELKDRLPVFAPLPGAPAAAATPKETAGQLREEVLSALTGLGYRRAQVEPVVKQVLTPEMTDAGTALKAVLRALAP
ncbi:MAG: Holliday junction branch migration protein RuvA [Magnetococcales bacterium]|nr:Holliday junction branch migration protein RuvA [Magnetococcales bacterium]